MSQVQENSQVTATLVAERDRLNFLPDSFGPRYMLRGEALVFGWIQRMCEAYNGGYWNFYTLSNGGFYMAPAQDTRLLLQVEGNGYSGEMSADAAGIVATLFALSQLTYEAKIADHADMLADRYHALRDFVSGHPEAAAIAAAID